MRSLTSPRHIAYTLVVTLVTAGLFGGVIGLAAADGPQLPARFGVPAPREGDVVVYNFTYTPDQAEAGATSIRVEAPYTSSTGQSRAVQFDGIGWGGVVGMGWYPPAEVRADDGRVWLAPVVGQGMIHVAIEPQRWKYEEIPIAEELVYMDGASILAVERGLQKDLFTWDFDFSPQILPKDDRELVEEGRHIDYAAGSLAACLLRHGLQGADVSAQAEVWLFAGCEDLGLRLDGALYRATGAERLPMGDAVRYDGPGATVWFAKDIPYPVRIEATADGFPVQIDLIDHVRGDGPDIGAAQVIDGRAAPPLRYGAVRTWGPDDAGFTHPFSLSAAIQAANTDPVYSDLRDWLQAHPGAFVMAATYNELHDRGDEERTWDVLWTDGKDVFDLRAVQTTTYAGGDAPRALGIRGPPVRSVSFGDSPFEPDMTLHTALPKQAVALPTIASMMAMARHHGVATPNAWSFALTCAGCDVPSWTAVAGYAVDAQDRSTDDPTQVEAYFLLAYRNDQSDLLVWQDGALQERVQASAVERPADTPPAVAGEGTVEAGTLPSAFWRLPDGQAATGVGLAALLAGALYYLWPVLKTGALAPLFSRIQAPQALEHPARRRVYDVIRERPGIHFQEIGREMGRADGALHHHVRRLVDTGLVVGKTQQGYTCYFVKGAVDRRAMQGAAALKSPTARQIMDLVRSRPGITASAAAGMVGVSASTVSHHVRRLHEAGLVSVQREGRNAYLTAL